MEKRTEGMGGNVQLSMFNNDLILMISQNKNASSYWPFSHANIVHFYSKD